MKLICPSCGRPGRIPSAGKIPSAVRCPGCSQRFDVAGAETVAEPGDARDDFLDRVGIAGGNGDGHAVEPASPIAAVVTSDPKYAREDEVSGPPPLPKPSKASRLDEASATVALGEKEPWFYAFLYKEAEGYRAFANLIAYLAAGFWLLWAAFYLAYGTGPDSGLAGGIGTVLLVGVGVAISAYFAWHALMLISARIHIGVDHARNDRRARLILERQMNP